jgi:hypothetical protein
LHERVTGNAPCSICSGVMTTSIITGSLLKHSPKRDDGEWNVSLINVSWVVSAHIAILTCRKVVKLLYDFAFRFLLLLKEIHYSLYFATTLLYVFLN